MMGYRPMRLHMLLFVVPEFTWDDPPGTDPTAQSSGDRYFPNPFASLMVTTGSRVSVLYSGVHASISLMLFRRSERVRDSNLRVRKVGLLLRIASGVLTK